MGASRHRFESCAVEPGPLRAHGALALRAEHGIELIDEADVVVNNAGVTGFEEGMVAHDPGHASPADWRSSHRVNLDGTFLGRRYAPDAVRPAGGGRGGRRHARLRRGGLHYMTGTEVNVDGGLLAGSAAPPG